MALSPLLSYFSLPFLLQLHLCFHMCYTPLFLLYPFLLPPLSNSMLPCNFHTTYCTTVSCLENPTPCSPEFLFPCSHILYTSQGLLPPILLSILYAHHCSSWRQSFYLTVLFHFLLHFLWWSCFLFFSSLLHLWTLPLLVPFLPTLEALPPLFYYFLSSHLFYPTLHYPIVQHFEPILHYCFLLLLPSIPTLLGEMPEPLTSPTYSFFSSL